MATPLSNPQHLSRATLVGLAVALLVPFLTLGAGQAIYGHERSVSPVIWGMALHWINFAALVAIVVRWERQPLASIGVRPLRWWTIPLGLAAGIVITIASAVLVNALRLQSDTEFVGYVQHLPLLVRVLLVVTAGVFEETLFRGYAIERLTPILGSKWWAALVTVTLFTLGHVPAVGWAHLAPVAIVSIFVTLLYLWRRDLIVNIVAHSTIDAIGVLVAPLLGMR